MWRQIAAVLVVSGLVLGAGWYLGITVSPRITFAFNADDVMFCVVGMFSAFMGGVISRRYGFALAVVVLYFALWCWSLYFVNLYIDTGIVGVFIVNSLSIAISLLCGMVGACFGVFISRRQAGDRI